MKKSFGRIAIVHHSYTPRCLIEDELLEYLRPQTKEVVYLTHPFKTARESVPRYSEARFFRSGVLTKTITGPSGFGPEVLYFFKDFFYNLVFFIFIYRAKVDVFFGVNNFNAFSGIILRKLGKVDKVVYYVIDYVPNRFSNKVINSIYRTVEFFCVKHADVTWNVSPLMSQARIQDGLDKKYLAKQLTVPVGCHPISKEREKPKINKNTEFRLAFLGSLVPEQGVDLALDTLAVLATKYPLTKLIIIGSGNQETYLKVKAKELKIKNNVEFKGYIVEDSKVLKILSSCHIGLAPYKLEKNSYKKYSDPSKIKSYFAAGLPVIITNISYMTKLIEEKNVGIVVKDNTKDLQAAIFQLIENSADYTLKQSNVYQLAQELDWSKIFSKAFLSL